MENKKHPQEICPWCGQLTNIIWVHGHGQCSVCGTNIDECCRGENCKNYNPLIPDTNKQDDK